MCRQLRGWLIASAVVLASSPLAAAPGPGGGDVPDEVAEAPIAVQRVNVPVTGLRDEATMVLVGTALIALGAAVRRSA